MNIIKNTKKDSKKEQVKKIFLKKKKTKGKNRSQKDIKTFLKN